MTSDSEMLEIFEQYWQLTEELVYEHGFESVAGVMIQQAMTLYKTRLSNHDYEQMMLFVYEARHQIRTLHQPVTANILN